MAAAALRISGEVKISGAINDVEFSAVGEASGDPSRGEFTVRLDYTTIPAGWHPLVYIDPKVNFLFIRKEGGAKNFSA